MATAAFKDLFSLQAADYARFRPIYPPELYSWLAANAPARRLAVDVGTGNGQAAGALATHFARAIGGETGARRGGRGTPRRPARRGRPARGPARNRAPRQPRRVPARPRRGARPRRRVRR